LTTYVRRAGEAGERRAQAADEDERRDRVAQLHLEHLERVDLRDRARPAVDRVEVGHETAGVDGGAVGDAVERGRAAREGQRGHGVGGEGLRAGGQRRGVGVGGVAEVDELRQRARGQRRRLGGDQVAVRPR
jgi:hypothetical protein